VPGIESALAGLLQRGYAVCVASSATHPALQRKLGLTGLLDYFAPDAIFSVTDVERGKPEPDLFLHAAASMGFEPARCVVVEDSPFGVAAAQAAGMRVVGCSGGVTSAEQLTAADVFLDDLGKLPEVVETLQGRSNVDRDDAAVARTRQDRHQ
jgi:beta-phosphoglucomutase-like phosphatase (HAD superfamily)